jgi:predicted PurR-regulated permease PerM
MVDDNYFKKIIIIVIIGGLLVLSYFLLKPILLALLFSLFLAFILSPVYNFINRKIKIPNLSALIVCIVLIVLMILPIIFLTPILIEQSIKIYTASQQLDFITPFKKIFPSLFVSPEFSIGLANTVHTFVINTTNSLLTSFSNILLDLPTILLQLTVIFFTLFYVLRDKEGIVEYIKSILPFSPEIENKLIKATKDVTSSVLYGMIIVGVCQGIIVSIGFFVFGVPNSLLLGIFAVLAGILPILGPAIIWVPVMIYLLIAGNTTAAIGIIVFGLLSHIPDYLVRPLYLSKRTNLSPVIALIGMIGGIFTIGVLGVVLGPLILSYLIIVMDLFKKKI